MTDDKKQIQIILQTHPVKGFRMETEGVSYHDAFAMLELAKWELYQLMSRDTKLAAKPCTEVSNDR